MTLDCIAGFVDTWATSGGRFIALAYRVIGGIPETFYAETEDEAIRQAEEYLQYGPAQSAKTASPKLV